jgi:hypothetical protein
MLDMERTEVVVLVVVLVAEDLLLPMVPEELSILMRSTGHSSEAALRLRNVLLPTGAEEVAVAVEDLVLGPTRSGPSGTWSELGVCDG